MIGCCLPSTTGALPRKKKIVSYSKDAVYVLDSVSCRSHLPRAGSNNPQCSKIRRPMPSPGFGPSSSALRCDLDLKCMAAPNSTPASESVDPALLKSFTMLQNGSDIRGIAIDREFHSFPHHITRTRWCSLFLSRPPEYLIFLYVDQLLVLMPHCIKLLLRILTSHYFLFNSTRSDPWRAGHSDCCKGFLHWQRLR